MNLKTISAVIAITSMPYSACSQSAESAIPDSRRMEMLDSAARLSEEAVEDLDQDYAKEAAKQTAQTVVEIKPGGSITAKDKPVIIDFHAIWCGPCHSFKPIFAKTAAEMGDSDYFISVDVDRNETLASQFQIRSIPQVAAVLPDGRVVFAPSGMLSDDMLKEFIRRVNNIK